MTLTGKGFLRHIDNLNSWNLDNFVPLSVAGQRVGYLKAYMCDTLGQWPELFHQSNRQVEFKYQGDSVEARSKALDEIVHQLVEQGVISHYLGEPYPVTAKSREDVLAIIDRSSAASFGVKTYGQHLNGYVHTDDGLKIWIARRAAHRLHFPNKLDNIVAGGLPWNLSLRQNLVKECHEEAAIPEGLVKQAKSTGAISYCRETELGLKPDTLYCYDLELPASFVPRNTDGEVAEFQLLPVEEVLRLVHDSDEFKLNCNLVLMDFFIRHGIIGPQQQDYLEIVSGLHAIY